MRAARSHPSIRGTRRTRRPLAALAAGLLAALLAAGLALAINLGILGAIGAPRGPGALGTGAAGAAVSTPAAGRTPAPWASPRRDRPAQPLTPLEGEGHHRFGARNDD